MRLCCIHQKLVRFPLTNILHKSDPLSQENYLSGITKQYISKYDNACPKKNSLCSLLKPPFLSSVFLYSVTCISSFYIKLENFETFFNSYSSLFSTYRHFIVLFSHVCLCSASQSFLIVLIPWRFFPISQHRPERTNFLSIFHDTYIKNLLIPSEIKWSSTDLAC